MYFLIAVSLSFIFMYIVLAAQFESFIHPVTILLTLPLAIPFGILSLLVAGQSVKFFRGWGCCCCSGSSRRTRSCRSTTPTVCVTPASRGRGHPAGQSRPAATDSDDDRSRSSPACSLSSCRAESGSATNRSIGVLVVGGQSLCLLLTLLTVPVFYSIFDDVKGLRLLSRVRLPWLAVTGPGRSVDDPGARTT